MIKRAILGLIRRCGYIVLKSNDQPQLLLVARAHQFEVELADLRKNFEGMLRKNFEGMATELADSRKGHECALRELEQARAQAYELNVQLARLEGENHTLRDQLTQAADENRSAIALAGKAVPTSDRS